MTLEDRDGGEEPLLRDEAGEDRVRRILRPDVVGGVDAPATSK